MFYNKKERNENNPKEMNFKKEMRSENEKNNDEKSIASGNAIAVAYDSGNASCSYGQCESGTTESAEDCKGGTFAISIISLSG